MDIALMNVRITFQKNEVVTDKSAITKMPGRISIPAMPQSVVRVGLNRLLQVLW